MLQTALGLMRTGYHEAVTAAVQEAGQSVIML